MAVTLDTIVSLCKRRGFIFQSSEIYGGLAATYDYGPLGVELKRNVKEAWWRSMVQQRDDMEGLDASILMHPEVWRASGHVESFTDPLVDCKNCKKRFRADHLKDYGARYKVTKSHGGEVIEIDLAAEIPEPGTVAGRLGIASAEITKIEFAGAKVACPDCGQKALTEPRLFNLMFRTHIGPVQDSASTVFLRPETAQGIFVNFDNVCQTMRRKLPFGIAQMGKSFRNEVTTKAFIFRTLEFEQMEIEYFVKPGEDEKMHEYWINERFNWYLRYGLKKDKLRIRRHEKDELAHYARGCADLEYLFPMGWSELEGIANRTDYDLNQHMKFSGKDLTYFDQAENRRYVPYVIEPSAGVDRSTMAFLIDSYEEETVKERQRAVLKLHPALAPIKIAVLPLLKNRPELVAMAEKITDRLRKRWVTRYDDTAAIGKLYRRQDEIGTPYCVTVDVQSLEDKQVTVRERDNMTQERISADRLEEYMAERIILDPPRIAEPATA
ncbi:glycine--tRNA ligase [Candidatus Sumerlaeota bacterium]|nr:glycine--tRNA ligase [Candidatus Sumerlaeota bacterium]